MLLCMCLVFLCHFLSAFVSFRVATKPEEKREQKKKGVEFKTAPDGRLIITESSDDEGLGSKIYKLD